MTDLAAVEVARTEPLKQMLLNSHSPVVLSCLEQGEAMFADLVSVVNPLAGSFSRKTRFRPVSTSQRQGLTELEQEYVSCFEVERYLCDLK